MVYCKDQRLVRQLFTRVEFCFFTGLYQRAEHQYISATMTRSVSISSAYLALFPSYPKPSVQPQAANHAVALAVLHSLHS